MNNINISGPVYAALILWTSAADAQLVAENPIPEVQSVVATGVDMRSGMHIYDEVIVPALGTHGTDLRLMSSRIPELKLQNSNRVSIGDFTHNFHIYARLYASGPSVTISGITGEVTSIPGRTIEVSYGGSIHNFGIFYPDVASPQTLQGLFGQSYMDVIPQSGGSNNYKFRNDDGVEILFSATSIAGCQSGLMFAKTISYMDGRIFNLSYDNYSGNGRCGRLSGVRSNFGESWNFIYADASKPLFVTEACLFNEAATLPGVNCVNSIGKVTFTYDAHNNLSRVDSSDGTYRRFDSSFSRDDVPLDALGVLNYTYTRKYYNLSQETPYLTETIGIQPSSHVKSQSMADGRSYTYTWNKMQRPSYYAIDEEIAGGSVSNPDGSMNSYTYTRYLYSKGGGVSDFYISSKPTSVNLGQGKVFSINNCIPYTQGAISRCFPGDNRSIRFPEGNQIQYTRNAYEYITKTTSIAKPGAAGPASIVTNEATYGNLSLHLRKRPTQVKDGLSAVTTYTYDQVHGGLLSKVSPPVNGVSPTKKYGYVQRYAWLKNSSGGYSQAATALWLLSEERTCRTTTLDMSTGACAGGAADLIVTSYDYGPNSGPNNLWLRGKSVTAEDDDGLIRTHRTCYGYDQRGQKIWEVSPRAGLAQCS